MTCENKVTTHCECNIKCFRSECHFDNFDFVCIHCKDDTLFIEVSSIELGMEKDKYGGLPRDVIVIHLSKLIKNEPM